MSMITKDYGSGGAGLNPGGGASSGNGSKRHPALAKVLRDIATDLAAVKTAVNDGLAIVSADPTAIGGGALGAFTDPPSAAEMAALRALVNEERVTGQELRTLLIEVKAALNSANTGSVTSADPTAIAGAALGAFTDPPSAAEMALARTLVNQIRVTGQECRTLAIEIKGDVNAGVGTVPALLTIAG